MKNKILLALGLLLGSGVSATAQVSTPDVCIHHLRTGEFSSCRVVERNDEDRCLCRYGIPADVLTTGSIGRSSAPGAGISGSIGQDSGNFQGETSTSTAPTTSPGSAVSPSVIGSGGTSPTGTGGTGTGDGGTVPVADVNEPGGNDDGSPGDDDTGTTGPDTGNSGTGSQNPGNDQAVGNAPVGGVTGNVPSGGTAGSPGNSADAGEAGR